MGFDWSLAIGIWDFMRVAIIGAGTVGLYLGWKLSEKGHQVQIFEKKNKIGQEVCSGLFSQRILDFVPESKKLIQNTINQAFLHFPKKTIELRFSKQFFVMSHYELDRLLLSLAEKAGAEIILNNMIQDLPKGFDRIIGCDGANSVVRRKLGLAEPDFRLGIQGFNEKNNFSDFVKTWPCQNGFLWEIPRGKKIEYGIITKPDLALGFFKSFLEKNNISIGDIKSRIIPRGLIIPKNSRITLCGDAAGLTKPWSGGGVIWGLSAADILLKTFPDFLKYSKKTKRFFYLKIILSKLAIKIVYKVSWLLPKRIKIESDFLL